MPVRVDDCVLLDVCVIVPEIVLEGGCVRVCVCVIVHVAVPVRLGVLRGLTLGVVVKLDVTFAERVRVIVPVRVLDGVRLGVLLGVCVDV